MMLNVPYLSPEYCIRLCTDVLENTEMLQTVMTLFQISCALTDVVVEDCNHDCKPFSWSVSWHDREVSQFIAFTIIADDCRCYCGVIVITIATDCHCHCCIAIISHCYCCCCRSDIFYEGWCIVFMSMRPNWIWIIVVWSMIRWWF